MNKDELKKLRDEAAATIARIDNALASMTDKAAPGRPFRRGEPVIMWDDEKYKFMGFFVKPTDGGFGVSGNSDLLHYLTWLHCEHLRPFIDWELIDPCYDNVAEYDSGLVSLRIIVPEIGDKNAYGTVVAVYKRPEARK
ncbi:MAG TPA: hypothetical protein VMV40_00805 [Acidiferrobacter sp.]|nr:hypothetical protein [Acidiferrobacter sp.]